MKLRNVGLLVAVLAATAACERSEAPAKHEAVTQQQTGSGSAGSAADPWSKPTVTKDPLKRPLFWSIEKDGKTDYILGTMHMGVDPESRIPDYGWKRLDAETTLAME